MLVNNFSAGILARDPRGPRRRRFGPSSTRLSDALGDFVSGIINAGLLPLADIPIEVGQGPVPEQRDQPRRARAARRRRGRGQTRPSRHPLPARDEPGPGPRPAPVVHVLRARGWPSSRAPGAIIIHFFGGIHEIYFPYVLSHPIMIVAMWAGGIAADTIFVATNAGLVATPSPGSIFAYLAVIPPGQHFGVLLGVAAGAVASFLVGSLILRVYPVKETEQELALETDAPTLPVGVPA